MGLFDTYIQPSQVATRRRNYTGGKFKLALSGSDEYGRSNAFGKVVNTALPVALGLISAYYTGSYQLGSQVGGLANKGLDAWGAKMLKGTDSLETIKADTAKNEKTRALVGGIGNAAASIYTAVGGPTNASVQQTKAENKMLDKALEGVSDTGLESFINDETFNLEKELAKISNANTGRKSLGNLNKFFGPNNDQPQLPFQDNNAMISGFENLGEGFRPLDEKPRVTTESTLPYNGFFYYAKGGETVKKRRKTVVRYFSGGESDSEEIKIYDPMDTTTEDFFMVDKDLAKEVGATDLLESIAWGQGRYGERIYDQQSNITQKAIMADPTLTESEKKEKLGEHIFHEIQTHPGMAVNFAQGAETRPKPRRKTATVPGSTQDRIVKNGLTKIMDGIEVDPMKRIVGYNKNGQAVYSTQVPTYNKKLSTSLLVVDDDYLPKVSDTTKPAAAKTSKPDDIAAAEARSNNFATQNAVATGVSAVQGLMGTMIAAEPIPVWEPSQEYRQMHNDIVARRNQGLSAEESANIEQNLQNTYVSNVEQIRQIGGGGATQGSVLAALDSAGRNLQRGYLDKSLLDIQARRQNQADYRNAVMTDLGIDQQMFDVTRQDAIQNRDTGLAILAQSAQDIYDQQQFNQSYGPSSLYNQYMQSQVDRERRYTDLAQLQSELALKQIQDIGKSETATPTTVATSSVVGDVAASTANGPYQLPIATRRRTVVVPKR